MYTNQTWEFGYVFLKIKSYKIIWAVVTMDRNPHYCHGSDFILILFLWKRKPILLLYEPILNAIWRNFMFDTLKVLC